MRIEPESEPLARDFGVNYPDLRAVRSLLLENGKIGHAHHGQLRDARHRVKPVVLSHGTFVPDHSGQGGSGDYLAAGGFIEQALLVDVQVGHLAALEGVCMVEQPSEILSGSNSSDHGYHFSV